MSLNTEAYMLGYSKQAAEEPPQYDPEGVVFKTNPKAVFESPGDAASFSGLVSQVHKSLQVKRLRPRREARFENDHAARET